MALLPSIWLALGACLPAPAETLTYNDLVHRLTDLEYLATFPAADDHFAQWSSYDRKSRYDDATGKYVNWDANGDGEGFIRKEGDRFVLAEMQGPGCIWRIWSAAPKEGHVRIYLDGSAEPAVDLPFVGYFDGKNPPFTRSAIVHNASSGLNNYTPIPYQKSCKIVADAGWGLYYHFGYETFPKDTQVPTFKRELSAEEDEALEIANIILAECKGRIPSIYVIDHEMVFTNGSIQLAHAQNPKEPVSITSSPTSVRKRLTLPPSKTTLVARLKGPRAITSLRLKLDLPRAPADLEVLRQLAIQIKWDGEAEPAVWTPLGDFFGTAIANNYRSLPLGHSGDEWWYSAWFMPFGKEARIELVNDGPVSRSVAVEISHAPLSRPAAQYARFHAKWHRDAFPPTEPERQIDWPIVKTEGAGRFVGVALHVWNPRGGWWGEGDEKFFVDGERFPSTFGTGSEDYFGYAWGSPALFQNAYHNQTHNDGNNRGHICLNRWHISDAVPFQKSFEGCIEKYFPNQRPTLYAATGFWYLAPGGKDPYKPLPLHQRVGYWTPVQTLKVNGAIEGERLKILSKTGGKTEQQDTSGFDGQWSNDAQLWWTEGKPGDKLELALPVSDPAQYKLSLRLTKAPDYGIVQVYLDDEKIGDPIDLYHGSVVAAPELPLASRHLSSGDHKLTIEIVGANDKAIKSFMFGLDYLKLETVQ